MCPIMKRNGGKRIQHWCLDLLHNVFNNVFEMCSIKCCHLAAVRYPVNHSNNVVLFFFLVRVEDFAYMKLFNMFQVGQVVA